MVVRSILKRASMITFCSWLNHFHSKSYYEFSAQVLLSLILVKNSEMHSRIGSRSSLYSLMHNNFLVLRKWISGGQDIKMTLPTL